MIQASTPTEDTVRTVVRSLLTGGEAAGTAGGGAARGDAVRGGAPRGGPAGAVPDVRPVAEGGERHTWWVGTRHVLRLAPDRAASTGQRRELRLRDLVRPHLPVPVPVSVAQGEWAAGLACTLDARLPGGSAEDHTVSAVGETDLAGLLTGLRDVPVRQAETLGVPREAPRALDALRTAAEEAAGQLAAADEFDPARLGRLTESAAVQLAAQPGAGVLVHHALSGEHLVVSADGRVRGVLDWSGAVVGDPAEDIAGLAVAVGAPAAVRAATLAGYGARPCLRGLWLARCDAVIRLAARLRDETASTASGASPSLLRTRLHRAWEPILLERVTDLGEGAE
ncbi:aminoglycoside phosphotransferase family protein [Streptomyces sp. NPDC054842]